MTDRSASRVDDPDHTVISLYEICMIVNTLFPEISISISIAISRPNISNFDESGFIFHPPEAADYSESAVILEEEATEAAFSSPPHRPALSSMTYRQALPTVGRRRISPV